MNRTASIIVGLILVVVIGVAVWLATKPAANETSQQSTSESQTTPPAATPQPAADQPASESTVVTVNYDNNGFNPTTITIKSGQTLTFVNKTSSSIQPASDPHPQHTENPELNVGNVSAGQSKSVTPKKTGTFGMHDHLNPSHTVAITVE
ncbi:MAG TPA: cupredoxin domain-containing protein [Candidatus Saccharimonadia bacterium]